MKKIYSIIAAAGFLGYFPFAPGTIASAAGLILCLFLYKWQMLYICVFAALFIAGLISADRVEKEKGQKDPQFIVIDEFACIFIVFLFIPLRIAFLLTGFILYRIFDITKIPPIRFFEKIKGSWGVMLDDLMAAIYANLILHILAHFSKI